ncbi:vomeronasal secretory protein 2-like [Alexandromys fortis]|uniref:vomeronasal secretory protein 2-like n=1 Tax=Alexandromys fortis TaxID=100897 RepID=UPI002152DAFE|nr:vomeronasal secretory protein 2-like [Microtus fortis]
MKSLLLTVTLFVLVIGLRAQDELPFLSEDKNVRQGAMVEGCLTVVQCLRIGAGTHELFSSQSLVFSTAPQLGVLAEEPCGTIPFYVWGTNLMYIYELPVMDHYILYSECRFLEQKVYMGELIGKDPTENHEALEEFKKFAQQKGFPPENIMVPEQRGEQVTLEIID